MHVIDRNSQIPILWFIYDILYLKQSEDSKRMTTERVYRIQNTVHYTE